MSRVVRTGKSSTDCKKSRNRLFCKVRDSRFLSFAGRSLKELLDIDKIFNAGRFPIVLGSETSGTLVKDKSCKRVNTLIRVDRRSIVILDRCNSTNDDGRYSISKINSFVELHKDVLVITNFRKCLKQEMNFGIHVPLAMCSSVIVEFSPSIAYVLRESSDDCLKGVEKLNL